MLSDDELNQAIERQQPRGATYPREVFCRSCGTGHLAVPGRPGACRRCGRPLDDAVFRRHPAP